MGGLTYLGTDLIKEIRNVGGIPNTGATGSQATDLLRHASNGIRQYLLAKICKAREEYYVFRSRSTVSPGVSRYRIPPRAAWQKLRALWGFNGTKRFKISPADQGDLEGVTSASGNPGQYLVEGNDIVLIPDLAPNFSGFLEFVYYCKPGDIVLQTAARQIPVGGIDVATKTVTFSTAIPTSWTTGLTYDVHSQFSGAELKMLEAPVATAGGMALTFSQAIDGSVFSTKALEEGDWVCITGESALPAVPSELHPIVARVAAMTIAESLGATEKVKLHVALIKEFLGENLAQMETRIEEDPIRIGGRGGGLGGRARFPVRRYQ